MSKDEPTSATARLDCLQQASEWLLRMENPDRTEEGRQRVAALV